MKTEFSNYQYLSDKNDIDEMEKLADFIKEHGGIIDMRKFSARFLSVVPEDNYSELGVVLAVFAFNGSVYAAVDFLMQGANEMPIEELRYNCVWADLFEDIRTFHYNLTNILEVIELCV